MPGKYTLPLIINGYRCLCVDRTSDSVDRAVVEHKIIGYGGPFLQDCGLNGRNVSLQTLWTGANYINHESFLQRYFKVSGTDTINHPVYGTLLGKIKNVRVQHAYNEKYAVYIDMEFIEQGSPEVFSSAASVFPITAVFTAAIIEDAVKSAQNKISAFRQLQNRINGVKSTIAGVKSRIAQGVNMFNAAIEAIIYPSTIAGEMLSAVVSAVDAANGSIEKLIKSPSAAIFGIRENLLAMQRQIKRQADFGGEIIADLILTQTLFNECLLVAAVNDAYLSAAPAIGIAQSAAELKGLEKCLKNTEKFANSVFDEKKAETMELANAFKTMREGVQGTLASGNRERQIFVGGETSVYMVLLEQKIPTSFAALVCARNNIENPNKVSGNIWTPIL